MRVLDASCMVTYNYTCMFKENNSLQYVYSTVVRVIVRYEHIRDTAHTVQYSTCIPCPVCGANNTLGGAVQFEEGGNQSEVKSSPVDNQ